MEIEGDTGPSGAVSPKRRTRFWRGVLAGFVVGCATPIALLATVAYGYRDWVVARTGEGLEAPAIPGALDASYDLVLSNLAGEAYRLEEARGQAVFLHFFGTGCVACAAEVPHLNGLFDALPETGVVFLAVAADSGPDLAAFRTQNAPRYPLYALDGPRPAPYNSVSATPSTWIVAPDGTIAFRHSGAALWDDPASIRFVQDLALEASLGAPEGAESD